MSNTADPLVMAVRTTQRQSDVGLRIGFAHAGRDGLGHRQRQSKTVGLVRRHRRTPRAARRTECIGPAGARGPHRDRRLSSDRREVGAIGKAKLHTIAVHRQRELGRRPGRLSRQRLADVGDVEGQLETLAASGANRDAGQLTAEQLLTECEQTGIALSDTQFGHGLHGAFGRGQRQEHQCLVNRRPAERARSHADTRSAAETIRMCVDCASAATAVR